MAHTFPVRMSSAVLLIGAGLVPVAVTGPAQAATPTNDDFAQATVVEPESGSVDGGADLTGNNEEASAQPGEPNHADSQYGEAFHSLWWSWTASRALSATLSTCGSAFDTRLAVYTGSAVDALTEVASSNNTDANSPCPGKLSYLTFDAVEGTTYHFAVDTDGPLTDGGEPRGDIHLHFITPPAPDEQPPPPDGDDGGDGADEQDTSPGTVVPIETVEYKMPDFEPSRHDADDDWQFDTLDFADKKLGRALADQKFYGVVKWRLMKRPQAQYRDELYKHPLSGAILRTKPHAGTVIQSSPSSTRVITLYYWSPLRDPDYQEYLQKKADLERKRCKLLDLSVVALNNLVSRLSYEEARKRITNPFWGECKVWIHDDGNSHNDYNTQITQSYVIDVKKFKDQNGLGLVITRPREPDFAIVLREDPRYLNDADYTALVQQSDRWVLPVSGSNWSEFTVQVVERSTGRLVRGAQVELWYIDSRGKNKTLYSAPTNADGDVTVKVKIPRPLELFVRVTVSDGKTQMAAMRKIVARNLGNTIQTPCGRTLTRSSSGSAYRGSESELGRCREMQIVAGNLGDGRGTAAPHTALIGETEAVTVEDGEIVAGSYNGVDISGENIIVGSGPGMLILGGGNVESYTTGHPLNLLGHLLSDLGSSYDSALSNVRVTIDQEAIERVKATQSVLSGLGYNPAASSLLSDKGLGLIGHAGGNFVDARGSNVISYGGGNVIANGGANVIANGGGNVIAAGGGNIMVTHGGAIMSRDGAG